MPSGTDTPSFTVPARLDGAPGGPPVARAGTVTFSPPSPPAAPRRGNGSGDDGDPAVDQRPRGSRGLGAQAGLDHHVVAGGERAGRIGGGGVTGQMKGLAAA